MIHRQVDMTFREEKVSAFLKMFDNVKDNIRGFEGCFSLLLLQDPDNPCKISTSSLWESEEHLNKYRQSELFAKTWAETKSYFSDKASAKSRIILRKL